MEVSKGMPAQGCRVPGKGGPIPHPLGEQGGSSEPWDRCVYGGGQGGVLFSQSFLLALWPSDGREGL